jgi:hypothetical protein
LQNLHAKSFGGHIDSIAVINTPSSLSYPNPLLLDCKDTPQYLVYSPLIEHLRKSIYIADKLLGVGGVYLNTAILNAA